MIKYLGNEQYGIWSTLLSIISWITLFDIGIGNGLRNKISESLAKNNIKDAQIYISSGYMIIGIISITLICIFLVISTLIPWQSVFNTKSISNDELKIVMNSAAIFLFVNFWLNLINQIFNGIQKTSIVVFSQFLSNFLSLIFIYILYKYSDSSLLKLTFFYGLSLIITNIVLSIWFFKKNSDLVPKISLYSKIYMKSVVSLGYKFFIIQIAAIVIFTTDKILITQLFGPEHVASYDVVFKLFSLITMVHSLMMAPLWSSYSDAYHRNDFDWIRKMVQKQLKISFLFVGAIILLIIFTKLIISLWINTDLDIKYSLIFVIAIYTTILIYGNIVTFLLNGINKLNIQVYISLLTIIINIPLAIFIVKYFKTDLYGIVLGTCITTTISVSIVYVYVSKTINLKGVTTK
jgi:O-antigen/teichoic acid export membrane protein